MAFQSTPTISIRRHIDLAEIDHTDRNLAVLLEANAETARKKARYRTDKERFAAEAMVRPLTPEKAFAYFGLMLGTFPPAVMFTRFALETDVSQDGLWFVGVMLIMNLVSAVVGFLSGKWIGKMVANVEQMPWVSMLILLPFIGTLWGFMAGGAGGFIFFVVGAIFGALIGGVVGAAALSVFGILHRIVQRGGLIETKHFLPLSLGVTFTICSVILGRI